MRKRSVKDRSLATLKAVAVVSLGVKPLISANSTSKSLLFYRGLQNWFPTGEGVVCNTLESTRRQRKGRNQLLRQSSCLLGKKQMA